MEPRLNEINKFIQPQNFYDNFHAEPRFSGRPSNSDKLRSEAHVPSFNKQDRNSLTFAQLVIKTIIILQNV